MTTSLSPEAAADAAAFAAAQRAGWTAEELRKVGFDEPERRAPGRPRRQRGRTSSAGGDGHAPGGSTPPQD